MILNYYKIAVRSILRHKVYSSINVAGLALGMASSILILLFVHDELAFDRFHKDPDGEFKPWSRYHYTNYVMLKKNANFEAANQNF